MLSAGFSYSSNKAAFSFITFGANEIIFMEKKIPNLLTLANLFCGFAGIWAMANGDMITAAYLVFGGALFDLLDGMAARLFKAASPIGKELDSLADIVTFGLLPAMIVQALLIKTHASWLGMFFISDTEGISYISFLLVAAAAWRLARYNSGDNSFSYFRGLPVPANAMFFASLPLILENSTFIFNSNLYSTETTILNPYLLCGLIFLFSALMVSKIHLFNLKVSGFSWQSNKMVYILVIAAILLFIVFFWVAVPAIIFLYLILSWFNRPIQSNEV
jgi:CDP-diacylglycerol--serine O-phosphatidyltransferase